MSNSIIYFSMYRCVILSCHGVTVYNHFSILSSFGCGDVCYCPLARLVIALKKNGRMQTSIVVRELCPTSTRQWLKTGAILLDIREAEATEALQFAEGNIMYMPLSQLMERFTELPVEKDIIVACERGVLSLDAAAFLQQNGFDRIYHMRKGLRHWVAKGYPVTGDTGDLPVSSHKCCGGHGHHHA